MTDTYTVLQKTEFLEPIDEVYFNRLIKDFRWSYLNVEATDGFGLWFINGFIKYPHSIKLGLSHYMGSVN
jgi:hypothetical protein